METTLKNKDILGSLGWTGMLAILPFDHRTGLYKEFGWTEPLTAEQVEKMKDGRRLIFEAIVRATEKSIPKDSAPVFTDDVFGREVLEEAKRQGFMTFLTTEKSGTPYYDFEHGNAWQDAITDIDPTFTKALVRLNPEGDSANNSKSLVNLRKLSDFSHDQDYKFVIEPLVAATDEQLASVGGDKARYDAELRPSLTVKMIGQMHEAGIEPDIWKIEGFLDTSNYEAVVAAARSGGRDHVGVISLGRNETDETVDAWLRAGSRAEGVIGFAVGRTIFLESLKAYVAGTMPRDEAVKNIVERFVRFYDTFVGK